MSHLLYKGPSAIDGQTIFAAVTSLIRPSANTKTGPMAQVFYLRDDIHPMEAIKTGQDESVCGSCKLRGTNGKDRSCYVNIVMQGPNAVYKTKGSLKPIPKNAFRNRAVRLGAYGEPTSVPFEQNAKIKKQAALVTGYTHRWAQCDQRYKDILMASVDTPAEREQAKALGWATFRVKHADDPVLPGEHLCPASDEAGKVMQCITCGGCTGAGSRDRVINVHGSGSKHFPIQVIS